MRRSKLSLDAKDFTTFAAWSDQDNLLSTCTPRSLSEIVHSILLLPRRRAWIGPMSDDCRCTIIALHFSGCGIIRYLSHHFWSSARTKAKYCSLISGLIFCLKCHFLQQEPGSVTIFSITCFDYLKSRNFVTFSVVTSLIPWSPSPFDCLRIWWLVWWEFTVNRQKLFGVREHTLMKSN